MRTPPGPKPHRLLGHVREFRRDPLGFLEQVSHDFGDVVGLRLGRKPVVFLRHPDHIQHVLQGNHRNYRKQGGLRVVVGNGLATSGGELWRRQRRLMQPSFQPQTVKVLGPAMARVVAEGIREWNPDNRPAIDVDVHREMMRLTLRIASQLIFGDERATRGLRAAAEVILPGLTRRLLNPFPLPLWIPTPGNLRLRGGLQTLNDAVFRLIARRRGQVEPAEDLLQTLLVATDDESSSGMSDRQLRDEVVTILLAAHENSGNALTWMCHLIAAHPPVQCRLRQELRGSGGDDVGDVLRSPYARMIIEESLRLCPPGWILRIADRQDEIGGYCVTAGCLIVISPYLTHRHPDFWREPERFDPERFANGPPATHPFAYIPFGAGPRKCIGLHFAMIEAQIVLSTLIRQYRLVPLQEGPVWISPIPALAPVRGLRLQLCRW